jgi:D-alanine-D-alanine ligase
MVVNGGTSDEREVSLRSGAAVGNALVAAGHTVTSYDPSDEAPLAQAAIGCDVAFPVIHGAGGEDGYLQLELEHVGLPYVGSGVEASQLCFNKFFYKQKLAEAGIPTAQSVELMSGQDLSAQPLLQQAFVLKPATGGSSIDTFIVRDVRKADIPLIESTLEKYDSMLLEELIPGTEITIGVLGTKSLPVVEIIPPASGEFDYENKYNGATQELCPPVSLNTAIQRQAGELAVQIHQLCGCDDYSRTDMIVRPDGSLVVLETNTLPGMTDQSLLPKAAMAAGIDMPTLCDQLVQLALRRRIASA